MSLRASSPARPTRLSERRTAPESAPTPQNQTLRPPRHRGHQTHPRSHLHLTTPPPPDPSQTQQHHLTPRKQPMTQRKTKTTIRWADAHIPYRPPTALAQHPTAEADPEPSMGPQCHMGHHKNNSSSNPNEKTTTTAPHPPYPCHSTAPQPPAGRLQNTNHQLKSQTRHSHARPPRPPTVRRCNRRHQKQCEEDKREARTRETPLKSKDNHPTTTPAPQRPQNETDSPTYHPRPRQDTKRAPTTPHRHPPTLLDTHGELR